MGLRRHDDWLACEACWEALRDESECIILPVTFLNKHHETAQREAAAALSSDRCDTEHEAKTPWKHFPFCTEC